MRTVLTLERYRNGQRVEKRQQEARSFVRGLFDLLYVAHAQTIYTAPYNCVDIMGQDRDIDSQTHSANYYPRRYKGNLAICGPSGEAGIYIPSGGSSGDTALGEMNATNFYNFMVGENLGIVIGADNTAVTPVDRALITKYHHGQNAAIVPETLMDAYETVGAGNLYKIYDPRVYAAVLLPKRGFRLTTVEVNVFRSGAAPGDCHCDIMGLDTRYQINDYRKLSLRGTQIQRVTKNANAFLVTPGQWEVYDFSATPVEIQPGLAYAIQLTCPAGDAANYVVWWYNDLGAGQEGNPWMGELFTIYGLLSPNDWTFDGQKQLAFRTRGTALAQFEYGGNEIFGYTVANPNASFNIRRLFRNNSGGALTVNECGIYAMSGKYSHWAGGNYAMATPGFVQPMCIARDVIGGGIAVADGEDLAVTYTPQITV